MHTHSSVGDLVGTLRDILGLNITVFEQNIVPGLKCSTKPGSCVKPMWPVSDPTLFPQVMSLLCCVVLCVVLPLQLSVCLWWHH